ncbi:hypothetical protein Q7P35_006362 [Cladosporium inversicolor]
MSDDEERVTMPFNWYAYTLETLDPTNILKRHWPYLEYIELTLDPPGFDARFPNQNQTKHCWQNYVDYHKCINAKGEDFKPCRQFLLAYRSLCPSGWANRWDDQREAGTFPARLDD